MLVASLPASSAGGACEGGMADSRVPTDRHEVALSQPGLHGRPQLIQRTLLDGHLSQAEQALERHLPDVECLFVLVAPEVRRNDARVQTDARNAEALAHLVRHHDVGELRLPVRGPVCVTAALLAPILVTNPFWVAPRMPVTRYRHQARGVRQAALLDEQLDQELMGEVIHLDVELKTVGGQLVSRCGAADAILAEPSIQNGDVEWPIVEPGDVVHHGRHTREMPQVRSDHARFAAVASDLVCHSRHPLSAPAVQDHRGTSTSQLQRSDPPNACVGTSHQRCFAVQAHLARVEGRSDGNSPTASHL
mmetsp:Transcript_18029/g.50089  ORF Transcript_18029/g.50089 Transcript_18029/m.50089 type:complete len:306 (+) Transcript_18029:47-964(+)